MEKITDYELKRMGWIVFWVGLYTWLIIKVVT